MRWENLRVTQFQQALDTCNRVCVLPIGCLEKHGNHLPLGTDIFIAREAAHRAAEIEPVMVFPWYPFGQVSEVRHMLGTIALDAPLQMQLMQALCDEIARNGFTKIIIANGHGGNNHMLRYFCQSQLDKRRDYVVYNCDAFTFTAEQRKYLDDTYGPPDGSGHADIHESSAMLDIRPELVDMDDVNPDESRSLGRMDNITNLYAGIGWYASHPYQFAGNPTGASLAMGRDVMRFTVENYVNAFRQAKAANIALELQNEFHTRSEKPGV